MGILEADTIKQVEMKHKIQKEYLRRKLLETKFSSRNLIKGINTWALPLVRYSGPLLKWTRGELKQMDQTTRKLMTMHIALRPRDDVDRLKKREEEDLPALGSETKGLLKGLEDLEVGRGVETIQMTALLRTARILRRVLEI